MVCARLKEPIIDPHANEARQRTMMTHLYKLAEMGAGALPAARGNARAHRHSAGYRALAPRSLSRILARMVTMLQDPGAVDLAAYTPLAAFAERDEA